MDSLKFPDLLYPQSPFLVSPEDINKNIDSILDLIKRKNISPLHGICYKLCIIADTLSVTHLQEYNWIKNSFNCNLEDLDWFFLGHTVVPTLIIAACIMEINSTKSLQILNRPTEDKQLISLNQYKTKLLPKIFSLTAIHLSSKPSRVIDPIYEVVNQTPFNTNHFYLAGIESSRLTCLDLTQKVESYLQPI